MDTLSLFVLFNCMGLYYGLNYFYFKLVFSFFLSFFLIHLHGMMLFHDLFISASLGFWAGLKPSFNLILPHSLIQQSANHLAAVQCSIWKPWTLFLWTPPDKKYPSKHPCRPSTHAHEHTHRLCVSEYFTVEVLHSHPSALHL